MQEINRMPRTPLTEPQISSDRILRVASTAGLLLTVLLVLIGWRHGIFSSQQTFAAFIRSLGWMSIPVFIVVQAIQVVIPILPAAIGCSVGVIVYGAVWGFVYNYVGICAGSIIVFLLARTYGLPLVRRMTAKKQFDKYAKFLDCGKAFDRMFTIAIFAPVAPDDLLCYLAGLTPMSLRRFTAIILLGKPLAIFLYSAGLTALLTFFWH